METVRIKLGTYEIQEDPIPCKVRKWYNRYLRLWEVWVEDEEGNQIGETRYGVSRKEADLIVEETEAEIKEG